MKRSFLSDSALWRLERGRAISLPKPIPSRLLRVCEGRLWLTSDGTAERPPVDVWLGPGDEMRLPDGERWIAEAWPSASFQILMSPERASGDGHRREHGVARLTGWLHALKGGSKHAQ